MKLTIFGSGYVGLVSGACFSDFGNTVTLVDTDARKVESLRQGQVPIFEPRLGEFLQRNVQAGRLRYTTEAAEGLADADIIFVAVQTPENADGSADLRFVEAVAHTVAEAFATRPQGRAAPIFVLKSTVPVGTADRCRALLPDDVEVVSNPEFLKEGTAIEDFLKPDRVVVGCRSDRAYQLMSELYAPFVRTGAPVLRMSHRSAEVAKYAANCFLAMKVSFVNDLALLAEVAEADIYDVRGVLARDARIGSQFLHPGPGYGGSCFPKDVQAFANIARSLGRDLPLIEATRTINERQRRVVPGRIRAFFEAKGMSKGRVALWGLSFKPETDDLREAPAISLVNELAEAGFDIVAYDPQGMENFRRLHGRWMDSGRVKLVSSAVESLEGADVLAVMTEWNEFRNPDFELLASKLRLKAVFDAKNLYRTQALGSFGLTHFGIGLKPFRA